MYGRSRICRSRHFSYIRFTKLTTGTRYSSAGAICYQSIFKMVNNLIHTCLLLLLLFAGMGSAQAQFTFDHSNYQKGRGFVTDVTGRKPDAANYDRVTDGSPWWYDYFIPADLADGKGGVYKNIPVKIDLLADKVFYKDSTGALFELMTPIKYLRAFLPGSPDTLKLVHAKYYPNNNDRSITGWMQLQVLGEAVLLQDLNKVMNENKAFSSAVADYTISNQLNWVVALDGQLYKIKKTKELQQLLAQRKPAMQQFVVKQKGFDDQVYELVKAFNRM